MLQLYIALMVADEIVYVAALYDLIVADKIVYVAAFYSPDCC